MVRERTLVVSELSSDAVVNVTSSNLNDWISATSALMSGSVDIIILETEELETQRVPPLVRTIKGELREREDSDVIVSDCSLAFPE